MRKFLMIGASLATLSVGACDGEVSARTTITDDNGLHISSSTVQTNKKQMRVGSRLDCPEREGKLRLVSASADGRHCAYRSRDGEAEVELQLASVGGPVDAHLLTLENGMRQLVPAAAKPPLPPEPPTPPEAPNGVNVASSGDRARVDLPGLHVDAQGDRATIRMPGVTIDANDNRADIRVRDGKNGDSVSIRADENGAEIRAREDARRANGDIRSTYLLASKTAGPAGWRVAGYRAEGPGTGPLVIGTLRAQGRDDDDLMDEVEDLIDRNIKG